MTFQEAVEETMTLAEKQLGRPLTEEEKQAITRDEKKFWTAVLGIYAGYTAPVQYPLEI